MKSFLREYWLWILIPSLFLIAGVLLLMVSGGEVGTEPRYDPF